MSPNSGRAPPDDVYRRHRPPVTGLHPADISIPERLQVPASDGGTTHAVYYPPTKPDSIHRALDTEPNSPFTAPHWVSETDSLNHLDRRRHGWPGYPAQPDAGSSVAAQCLDDSNGVIRGKAVLRAYWAEGLRRISDLHFEGVDVCVGVHTLAISYRNQLGRLANKVLIFDALLVTQGHRTYLGSGANPARGGAATDQHDCGP